MPVKLPHPFRKKFMRYKYSELRRMLKLKAKEQLYYDIEEYGTGFVIPDELLTLIMNTEGTVEDDVEKREILSANATAEGTTGATMTIGIDTEGGSVEIVALQASWKMAAVVAARDVKLLIPNVGLGGVALSLPTTMFGNFGTVLTTGQYGYMVMVGNAEYIMIIANGALTETQAKFSLPMTLGEGAVLQAAITANGQALDTAAMDIRYKVVGD